MFPLSLAQELRKDAAGDVTFAIPVLDWIESPSQLWLVYYLGLASIVLMIAGVLSRITTIAALLFVLSFIHRGVMLARPVDDILAMPFSPEELLARSIVITRRATGLDRPIVPTIKLGEIEIDILNRQVLAGESVVHLSGIEQSLLYLLASRGGQVVTRDEILDAIWGTDFVAESNIVDRHIRSLRIKLQNDYRAPRFIATVPGRGYRFIPTFTNVGWGGGGSLAAE
jgi:DNA-binding winged helix-turn-helix (wHTH) protein